MTARTAIARAQNDVLRWYAENRRGFPWRETHDPYRILVSEVMLQQTQTSRVEPAYRAFLRRFPTVGHLARASGGDVLRAWGGLGYNRRAVSLQRAARSVVHEHGGVVPREPALLQTLPGIGSYTASAVACFAYDAQIPVVDTNVRRVLSRAAHGVDASALDVADVSPTASAWLPVGRAYEWNQALMDIGATVCRGAKPRCGVCPVAAVCAYKRRPHPPTEARPARRVPRFQGSPRQTRGAVVRALREARGSLTTITRLTREVPGALRVLPGLERDGLVVLSPAARAGSPRGVVRLPR